MPRKPEVTVLCDACKRTGAQDKQYLLLCQRCGTKIRSIDAHASNPFLIRGDMARDGIPLSGKKHE